jgi:hypothetical protein
MTTSQLAAIVDGKPLEPTEAKALWERFSAYMDAHEGDFDGFASQEGMVSARVAVVESTPTLTLARTAAEKAPSGGALQKPQKPQKKQKKRRRRGKRRKPPS